MRGLKDCFLFGAGGALCLSALVPAASAQVLDATLVASGFADPLWIGSPPCEDRLFVLEQTTALIKIIENGVVNPIPFVDLGPFAGSGSERGLLGLAFHPDYADNGYLFVNYTNNGGATVIARLTRNSPTTADINSLFPFLTIPQPFSNHNGGCIRFGPDGYLYIGMGDGGSANDPSCNAQNKLSLLGKMLRIDVNSLDTLLTYSVPPTNPFVGDANYLPEIFHMGLRNPWRFAFDRITGDTWIGDVGQDAREEVNFVPYGVAGVNFGWRIFEGNLCNGQGSCPTATVPSCTSVGVYTAPIHTYNHAGSVCSVTGGNIYRGCAIPSITGKYFFADYCSNNIWSFEWNGVAQVNFTTHTTDLDPPGTPNVRSITSFGEDMHGEIHIVDQDGGEIWKIVPEGAAAVPCAPLIAGFSKLSVSEGGIQNLCLDAGVAHAGKLYFLVGSASGTVPGLVIDSLNLPLNLDAYMLATIKTPNQMPFDHSLGLLDAQGRADALFYFPGALLNPGAVGLTLNHAYAVVNAGGPVVFTSNAAPVSLTN